MEGSGRDGNKMGEVVPKYVAGVKKGKGREVEVMVESWRKDGRRGYQVRRR